MAMALPWILDGNMKSMIKKLEFYLSAATTHCISGDFRNVKQMSAGITTTFKEHLDKQKLSDFLNSKLT